MFDFAESTTIGVLSKFLFQEKAVEEADKGDDCDSMGVSAEARQENSISDQLKPSVALNTTGKIVIAT